MEYQLEEKKIQLTVKCTGKSYVISELYTLDQLKEIHYKLSMEIDFYKENEVVNEDFQISNVIVLKFDRATSILLSLKEANNLRTLLETYLNK